MSFFLRVNFRDSLSGVDPPVASVPDEEGLGLSSSGLVGTKAAVR